MAIYLDKKWTKSELLSYLGDINQAAGARLSVLEGGKADGVRAVEVYTGSGLRFTVLPGRGMDIPYASYREKPLSFLSSTGITSPSYYEEPGSRWLRSFFAGLLTTCGITYSGAPGPDGDEELGLHGRISNAAAEDMSIEQEWNGDEFIISLKGKMREASSMGENMSLTRTITTRLGEKGFHIQDLVENRGFEPQPLMMLYHFNFGFPLLSPGSRVVGPITAIEARDDEARKDGGAEEALAFPPPETGYKEKVYFHTLSGENKSFIGLVNPDTGGGQPLGIVMRFNQKELPCLTEWKMPCRGFYVLGLEPGTAIPMGRGYLRDKNELLFLDGQESYPISIGIQILDTMEEIEELEREAETMKKGTA